MDVPRPCAAFAFSSLDVFGRAPSAYRPLLYEEAVGPTRGMRAEESTGKPCASEVELGLEIAPRLEPPAGSKAHQQI